MSGKKWIISIIAIVAVVILALTTLKLVSAPELKQDKITEMNIQFQMNGVSKWDVSGEDISLICETFNGIAKDFSGFHSGKGWNIWLSCSSGQEISVVGNTIVYHGIISREFSASENDIQEFVLLLNSLRK